MRNNALDRQPCEHRILVIQQQNLPYPVHPTVAVTKWVYEFEQPSNKMSYIVVIITAYFT
jgi:hypothetical protein